MASDVKSKPLWQKILTVMDLVCMIVCAILLFVVISMEYPDHAFAITPRLWYQVLMGLHFVMHGILNWKEHRWLAVFELGAVAFVLVLAVLTFLR